jgi:acyl carrier protein
MNSTSFDSFALMLVERLGLECSLPLEPCSGLFDDLGIDSFQVFEIIMIVEMAAGLDVPPPELPEILTLGDAFRYYQSARALAASVTGE